MALEESFTLPTQVPVYNNGNVSFQNITWDNTDNTQVDTTQEGVFMFEGSVEGYSEKILLALQVGEEPSHIDSVFPEEVDNFRLPKFDTLTTNLQDIDDYQFLKIKIPRRMEEQSHIKLLKQRLAEYKIDAKDFDQIESAIVNIEEFVWYLRDKIINRIEITEKEIEDIEDRIDDIEEEIVNIETSITDMEDSVFTDAENACNGGASVINSVGDGNLNLKGIRGENNIESRLENGCIVLSLGGTERSITIMHRGEGSGRTNATGQDSVDGQGVSYTFTATDGDTINISGQALQSGYILTRWMVNGQSRTGNSITLSEINESYVIEVFFDLEPIPAGEPLAYEGGNKSVYLTYELGTESGLVVIEYHMGSMYPDRMEIIYPRIPESQLSGDYSANIQAITGHPPFLWRESSTTDYRWRMPSLDGSDFGVSRQWANESGVIQPSQNGFVHREGKMFFYYRPENGQTQLGIRVKPTDFTNSSWFLYVHPPNARDLGYAYRMRAGNSNDWHSSTLQYVSERPTPNTMRTPIIREN